MNTRTTTLLAALAAASTLAVTGNSHAATLSWIAGADGAWEVAANWQTDDTVPVNRVPTVGDQVRPGGGGHVITYSSTSGSTTINGINTSGANPVVFLQTGGNLTVGSNALVFLASNAGATQPNYTISGGSLTLTRNLNLAWNNTANVTSTFLQTGGTVIVGDATNDGVSMAIKNNGQSATYELQGGSFETSKIWMGDNGNNYTALFNQSAGDAVIKTQIVFGDNDTKTGTSIYNLDGGTLTVENTVDPFKFTTNGASTAYLDFDGGTLNLEGTWDFASLTGLANSDFRVSGVAATSGDLAFTAINIDGDAYTQITVVPEPGSLALLGFGGLLIAARRRRNA